MKKNLSLLLAMILIATTSSWLPVGAPLQKKHQQQLMLPSKHQPLKLLKLARMISKARRSATCSRPWQIPS